LDYADAVGSVDLVTSRRPVALFAGRWSGRRARVVENAREIQTRFLLSGRFEFWSVPMGVIS
jgi:hypothetical protein